jgi:hypothetical protein
MVKRLQWLRWRVVGPYPTSNLFSQFSERSSAAHRGTCRKAACCDGEQWAVRGRNGASGTRDWRRKSCIGTGYNMACLRFSSVTGGC